MEPIVLYKHTVTDDLEKGIEHDSWFLNVNEGLGCRRLILVDLARRHRVSFKDMADVEIVMGWQTGGNDGARSNE